MQTSAHENYLVTQVLTAPPQKLQLMLIEAAIRAARLARQKWQGGENEAGSEPLIRAQEIVSTLIAGLNREVAPELVQRVASVYLFVYRSLIEANLRHDEKKLDDAIRVLEEERKTWQEVCATIGAERDSGLSLEA